MIDDNGLVIKNDPRDLALAIKRLLKDDRLRKRMGTNSIKKAKQFDWDIITNGLEKYYESVVNGN